MRDRSMLTRIGILSAAHMHSHGYAHGINSNPNAALVGVWDDNRPRGEKFADRYSAGYYEDVDKLLDDVDAVVITSENKRHAEMVEWAAAKGRHVLCEKPLVTDEQEADRMRRAIEGGGIKLMTAFPCRYSPAFARLKQRIANSEIGEVLAVSATNHGRCPFDWFVEVDKSGGGAMTDHVVHVADLMRVLLAAEPMEVYAQTGNRMYGELWEDTAMLHVKFDNGVFVTIDSSWSRPPSYKTWGDVTMNVVGEKGVIALDMFSQAFDVYQNDGGKHWLGSYGSDLDAGLIADFVKCVANGTEPPITFHDGWQASRVTIAGYQSVESGQPVAV